MNKQLSAREVVAQLESGMTIGFGGWGLRRKPMALVREILRSDLKDLTIVCYGGPEVGMLCAAGKVRKVVFGFVTLDVVPLDPYFRQAREAGLLEVMELDEGMVLVGLQAAAARLPFLPCRLGLATDVLKVNPDIKTIQSPYVDGELLVAMPALNLDVAMIHVDEADQLGNTRINAHDPHFDDLYARAAKRCFVTAERVVERLTFNTPAETRFNPVERSYISGVVHAPGGAHPTTNAPEYGWDVEHVKQYCATAKEGGWQAYMEAFVKDSEAAYQESVGGLAHIRQLPAPAM